MNVCRTLDSQNFHERKYIMMSTNLKNPTFHHSTWVQYLVGVQYLVEVPTELSSNAHCEKCHGWLKELDS